MIKKSGINISPAEVEDVLMRHPAVARPVSLACPIRRRVNCSRPSSWCGRARSRLPEELVAHCRAVASRYKVPDYIEIRDSLPSPAPAS